VDSPFNAWEMDQIHDEFRFHHAEIISKASAKDYVEHLQQLFPNMTSLTLVNESGGHEEYLSQLLIAFIQSDGAQRIQELEIQNCRNNYLGHILNALDPNCQPRFIIENMSLDEESLKAIKNIFQGFTGGSQLNVGNQLESTDGDGVVERRVITSKDKIQLKMTSLEKIRLSFKLECEHESNQTNLFLMSLPKHLPLLRQINISQRMFGHDQEFCKQQIANVQEKFPDLIIHTTL